MLLPKLFTTIKDYSLKQFWNDLTAGTIVGIVALPLAIAFAIASGVSPEKGLYTAIIAGLLISLLGGSRVQIGGPTGAFVIIVYSIIQKYGINGLTIATIMAGIILIIMGLAKLGGLIKYISYPIIVGFTSGIAVTIFSSQIKDFFGMSVGTVPSEFIAKWAFYFTNIATTNPTALIISLTSLLFLFLWPKFNKKIPASLIVIIVSTLVVQLFQLDVATIHSKFGAIPSSLPTPVFPKVDYQTIRELISPAITIALLAAIESLLSAVVADQMIGGKHRANMELIAQGVANIFAPLFGGIPATGAIARTATNIKNGGRTPIAGIIHTIVLLMIMLLLGKWAGLIPLASLAAILVYVSYNMAEVKVFKQILTKCPLGDILSLLVTFSLTVLVDLTVAIEVGMILAAFIFMKQMADVANIQSIQEALTDNNEDTRLSDLYQTPNKVEILELNGPFFFGSVDKFRSQINLKAAETHPEKIVLRMRAVPYMDSGGLKAFEEIVDQCQHQHIKLALVEVQTQPRQLLEKSGLISIIGQNNIYDDFNTALKSA